MAGSWRGVLVACGLAGALGSHAGGCIEEVPLWSQLAAGLVDSVCARRCGCEPSRCQDWAASEAERVLSLVEQFDLTFDARCFESRVVEHVGAACQPTVADSETRCGYRCRILTGPRGEGAECRFIDGNTSNCRQGLQCVRSVCVDPCSTTGDGEPCDEQGFCPRPSRCDPVTNLCVSPAQLGEPCAQGCSGQLDCIDGVCSTPVENGAACRGHAECLSQNCPAGFCAPKPTEGDACGGGVRCDDAYECDDGVCVFRGGAGDPCPCGDGNFVCSDGVCEYVNPFSCGSEFMTR